MASITTKFDIGDTFWVFDSISGSFTRCVVAAIGISAPVGFVSDLAPEIYYTNKNSRYPESDCLDANEAHTIGNLWLADKTITIFTSVGL